MINSCAVFIINKTLLNFSKTVCFTFKSKGTSRNLVKLFPLNFSFIESFDIDFQ